MTTALHTNDIITSCGQSEGLSAQAAHMMISYTSRYEIPWMKLSLHVCSHPRPFNQYLTPLYRNQFTCSLHHKCPALLPTCVIEINQYMMHVGHDLYIIILLDTMTMLTICIWNTLYIDIINCIKIWNVFYEKDDEVKEENIIAGTKCRQFYI